MDPNNTGNVNLPGLNPYIKRQVWLYLITKYTNLDRTNIDLIYNSVLIELTDSTDFEQLYKSLQIEDEDQRLLIINQYLSNLVPKIIDRLATKKNSEAQASIVRMVRSDVLNSRNLKFDGKSILDAFKSSTTELPSSEYSKSPLKSSYSQLLDSKYKHELQKLGNPSVTSPDFKMKTDRALEETNLFQNRVIAGIESNPSYRIFDPNTGKFQDFKTAIVNQRLSKLVVTGVIQPHGPEERNSLISSILKGDFLFLKKLHISGPEIPPPSVIVPKLKLLIEDVKKTANGELQISSDPLAEFNSYTDTIRGDSDSRQIESKERDITSLRISLNLSTQALDLQNTEEQSVSDGVNYIDTVVGFSENLRLKKQDSGIDLKSKLGISDDEFSIPQAAPENIVSSGKEKGFFVSSDVLAGALSFAVNQSVNSSKLSSEDKEVLKKVQAQVLATSGRMGLSFETQEELEQYLQSVRNLNPAELFKQFKNYTNSVALPELDNRLSVLQGKMSLFHSNIYQNNLSKEARSEQITLARVVGNKIFNKSLSFFPKLLEAKETLDFLRKLKNEGIIPAVWSKKVDILIMASDAVGLKEFSELLEKYNRIKTYYHLFQDVRKTIHKLIYRNSARLKKVVRLLNPIKLGRKALSLTRRSLAYANKNFKYIVFLQNDVIRTFKIIFNRNSVKNFFSRSKVLSSSALSRFSTILESFKNRSVLPFSKINLDSIKSGFKRSLGIVNSISKSGISKGTQRAAYQLSRLVGQISKINLDSIKSGFKRSLGIVNSISKSGISKGTQRAAYQLSRLVGQKFMIVAAKTTAKFAAGVVTAGLGFLGMTAVEYIGIKRALVIIASVIFAIIFIILYYIFLVISTISGSFNSSTSDTSREYNTGYTYGTISGSGVSLSFLGGSLDSNDCAERVQSWGGGTYGTDVWDNINKRRFTNLRVTTSNCKVICNMARAIAGLQPSSRQNVKGLNCNPNYYNGVIHSLGPSQPYAGYSGPNFGYYACNYLTYSAYNTRGSVVDPSMTSAYEKWTGRLFHDYCNSTPFESIAGAYGDQTRDELISNKITNAGCNSSFGDADIRMQRWLMIPARVQDAGSESICIPRELVNPGDVFYDGVAAMGCLYGSDSRGNAVIHTGLVLEVTRDTLFTLEANADVKTLARSISDCTARLNNQDVPGFKVNDSGRRRYLCRFFRYNQVDPDCPTDGSPYNCPEIVSGTPGFMRD